MEVAWIQPVALVFFILAVLHTFLVKRFRHLSLRFRSGSVGENLFHFLGEVEVVFGLWATLLIFIWSVKFNTSSAIAYLDGIDYTEPFFVFVIMCIAASKPIMVFAKQALDIFAKLIPGHRNKSRYLAVLAIGPILGSLITEPAAMTVCAFLVRDYFFRKNPSERFKYATLGLLFVNISIGGTLTHFAAPPVLMVASAWGYTTPFMFTHFGSKAILAIFVATGITAFLFSRELKSLAIEETVSSRYPWWMTVSHLIFLVLTIMHSHHMSFFVPLFLLFLGWCAVTAEHQDELRLKESLLVAYFLGGLVTLGKLQDFWLKPLISDLDSLALFSGATVLTAFTDNAALTYLGTLVPGLSDEAKYFLLAGAVTGGGLTVIANAPNPAGYGILRESFGPEGISPLRLFLGSLPYTLCAFMTFLVWR